MNLLFKRYEEMEEEKRVLEEGFTAECGKLLARTAISRAESREGILSAANN